MLSEVGRGFGTRDHVTHPAIHTSQHELFPCKQRSHRGSYLEPHIMRFLAPSAGQRTAVALSVPEEMLAPQKTPT